MKSITELLDLLYIQNLIHHVNVVETKRRGEDNVQMYKFSSDKDNPPKTNFVLHEQDGVEEHAHHPNTQSCFKKLANKGGKEIRFSMNYITVV